jgi:hypothetical protein
MPLFAVPTPSHRHPLLDLDPALGELLPMDRRDAAARALRVDVRNVRRGLLDLSRLDGASPCNLGLLIVDGVLARDVLLSDTVSTELLGPGDLIRPWGLNGDTGLLQSRLRWCVLSHGLSAAVLDRRFFLEAAAYPEITVAIVDRLNERAARLGITKAISQLKRVDSRLTALFWHLADRWGRMTAEGVVVPLRLSHRMLAELIGARRPTVSAALGELAHAGELRRREDGSWLLGGDAQAVVGL